MNYWKTGKLMTCITCLQPRYQRPLSSFQMSGTHDFPVVVEQIAAKITSPGSV